MKIVRQRTIQLSLREDRIENPYSLDLEYLHENSRDNSQERHILGQGGGLLQQAKGRLQRILRTRVHTHFWRPEDFPWSLEVEILNCHLIGSISEFRVYDQGKSGEEEIPECSYLEYEYPQVGAETCV